MILIDTNILSTFSKIGRLELLYKVFNKEMFHISPNVDNELRAANIKGYTFVAQILNFIENKR